MNLLIIDYIVDTNITGTTLRFYMVVVIAPYFY